MKRKRSIGLSVGICLLLLGLFSNISVFAAVTEGKAGETLTGEYAVTVSYTHLESNKITNTSSATLVKAMRQACKNILYTTVNLSLIHI